MREALTAVGGVYAPILLAASAAWAGPGGTLSGTVTVTGPAPARPPLPVFKNADVCGKGARRRARGRIARRAPLRGGQRRRRAGRQAPERDVTLVLDNRACRFDPHVLTAEVGSGSSSGTATPSSTTRTRASGRRPSSTSPCPRATRSQPARAPGLIAITCDVRHTWMKAFVAVTAIPTTPSPTSTGRTRSATSRRALHGPHLARGARHAGAPVTIEANDRGARLSFAARPAPEEKAR